MGYAAHHLHLRLEYSAFGAANPPYATEACPERARLLMSKALCSPLPFMGLQRKQRSTASPAVAT
ncbi:hypothetical protein PSEUDO8O_150199 [Pseudomonas sp. 8O]|nr:hypothetical protein PSEUDO8O_150199 [Pseudomonas sp. 8O]